MSLKKRDREEEDDNVVVVEPAMKRLKLVDDSSINEAPTDVLLLIFSFLDVKSLNNVSRVSIEWYTVSSDDIVWRNIYEQCLHLPGLISKIDEEVMTNDDYYANNCTWRPSLVLQRIEYFNEEEEEEEGEDAEAASDEDQNDKDKENDKCNDDKDDNDNDSDDDSDDDFKFTELKPQVNLSKLINNFGAPLRKGTIEDQFYLIQDDYYLREYKQEVEQVLGVTNVQIEEDYRNTFKNMCKYEQYQYKIYQENCEAKRRENEHFDPCYSSDDDDDDEEPYWKNDSFVKCLLKTGIHRLTRRAGVLYYEPATITDMLNEKLRNYLSAVINEAAKKLEGKEIKYTQEGYTGIWDDNRYESDEQEEDNKDKHLKINCEDIVEAIEKLHGKKLHGFITFKEGTQKDKTDANDDRDYDKMVIPEAQEEEEEKDGTHQHPYRQKQEEHQMEEEEEEEVQEEAEIDMLVDDDDEDAVDDDDSFIDDSELETINPDILDDDHHDTLQNELIKASIKAHEEVYGRERTHKEKLYLKNWYGYGPSMFQHTVFADSDDGSYLDDDFDYSGKKEQDL